MGQNKQYLLAVGLSSYIIRPIKNKRAKWWRVLDDGSPTSANLGNDHGFISEEY